ncbi:peptidoglycan recognition protein family protein [Denitromonas sp.]|uniref:peptidoglycan recognition protein family protein n=1 Tax=Denitromonas sp. TaxID=2734609 RepID=UPI002FDD085E
MSSFDAAGMLVSPKVQRQRYSHIEHGSLQRVRAIVVHQTDSGSAQATFNAYAAGGNGAHFLIAKDGRIVQTASIKMRCYHVGRLIKSRCLELKGAACKDAAIAKAMALGWAARIKAIDQTERQKAYPDRFPVNSDSIGIELVGRHLDSTRYEPLSPAQLNSLQWLLDQLYAHLSLDSGDVFKHPQVSYKNPGEAASAQWQ